MFKELGPNSPSESLEPPPTIVDGRSIEEWFREFDEKGYNLEILEDGGIVITTKVSA